MTQDVREALAFCIMMQDPDFMAEDPTEPYPREDWEPAEIDWFKGPLTRQGDERNGR